MLGQDPTISTVGNTNIFGASNDSLAAESGKNYITSTDYQTNNQGNAVTSYNIKNISADKITAGIITVALSLGGANVTIDGATSRIIVNDGTTNRVLIGLF